MKASDKSIFLGVGVLALAALVYFMLIAPKRDRAAELETQISGVESQISEQEQTAAFGEEARRDFPEYYGRLVTLGKAVPGQADSASLLVQLSDIAGTSKVEFRGISLSDGSGGSGAGSSTAASTGTATAPSTAAPAAGEAPAPGGTPSGDSAGTGAAPEGSADAAAAAVATPVAAATEATAAAQPIGAVVGPAGLATLPYELNFRGGFFDVADYIGGVDSLVQMSGAGKNAAVDGRLITIDGFALKLKGQGGDPLLDANFMVTTFVTPPQEGLLAGATPSGPAPTVPTAPETTQASAVTP